MKISGQNTIDAPVAQVWDALLDPAVLVATIPGCERLVATDEHAYDMTVSAGVAAIRGTYTGRCALSDLHEHESLVMTLEGAGAPGTVAATVTVGFAGAGERTELRYDADAIVGGMIGGVGQRMLTSVSRRMAAEFFGNVERVLADGLPAPVETGTPSTAGAQVHTARPAAAPRGNDFLVGVAVGGALVLAGVAVGAVLGRRR